ncbi:MAG: DUF4224 domain-containing protein [Pseudomonadota bacterium]|nr:DUF4224 domain-containing protein [Pseudomonadota bacterium]MDP1905025.1 DUF4224 domain-containing protein [Pseudomonadota bacterium]MDP2354267.1 DUF4224 domain-containing protein [Pseudomonadota bacterium]
MFLTPEELSSLTGLDQPAAQERLLREWGLTVFRNRANRVMLDREALTRWQLGVRMQQDKEPKVRLRKAA